MGILDEYNGKLEEIKAIPDAEVVKQINIPVAVYAQEAENLFTWAQEDKKDFKTIGMNMALLDEIPIRAGALRYAEAVWIGQLSNKKEAAQKWKEQSPRVYELRADLLQQFRFAYRHNSIVLARINTIAGSMSYANMFQDLHALSVLGTNNPAELKAINFDMSLLEKATALADELSSIFAATKAEDDLSEAKIIRDKAYSLLKIAVDEVCACGQHINRKNPARKKGYSSAHLRRVRNRYKKSKENGEPEEE